MPKQTRRPDALSLADQLHLTYGQSMFHAQCVEQDVESFVVFLSGKQSGDRRDDKPKLARESLGVLWRRVEPECARTDPVWAGNLNSFIRWRNYMAHGFLLDAAPAMSDEAVLSRALAFLEDFQGACRISAYHLALLRQNMGATMSGMLSGSLQSALGASEKLDESTLISFERFQPHA